MPSIDNIVELRKLLGEDAVLLPLQPGTKKCLVKAWQKIKLEDTKVDAYTAKLLTSNIAVSLGSPSKGLISIDFDDEQAAAEFIDANPGLAGSLRTRGVRGCNVWVKIEGEYPGSTKIMHRDTNKTVGEWRSSGNYTVVHGKHPSGCDYTRLVDAPVVKMPYKEIVWPSHLGLNDPTRALQKVAGKTLTETILDNRRKFALSLLDDVEWIAAAEAFCTCPGKDLHTNADGPRDCRVKIDGVPTVFCIHASCLAKVKATNEALRRLVRSQEIVLLPDGHVKVADSAEQLYTVLAGSKQFYNRGGQVVEVIDGTYGPELCIVDKIRAISTFERFVGFGLRKVKDEQEFVVPCTLREQWAAVLLRADERNLLPTVDSVVSIPILYRDPTTKSLLVHNNGYNPDTRTFVANPDPKENLPVLTLAEAVDTIKDLLTDFTFESPSHRSRAIASFLTPAFVFSGLLGGRPPVDVAEADQSQSGKNFRHKLICSVYGETPRPITQRKGGVGGLDESIAEALIRGKPFPQLDNLRGHLDSTFLEAFLTAEKTIGARGFGRAEMEVSVERFCTLITSNDLQFTQDLANRSTIIRIRKKPNNYPWKSYSGLRLDEHVKLHRCRYLAAVYRVVQEWHKQGCQQLHRGHHDFRWWAGRMDWIIENFFPGEAPLLEGHKNAQARAGDSRLGWWQKVAFELEKQGRLGQPLQMLDLRDLCLDAGIQVYRKPGQEWKTFNNDVDELKSLGKHFAPLFAREAEGVLHLDGFKVKKVDTEAERVGNGCAYSIKAYVFSRFGAPEPETPMTASPPSQTPVGIEVDTSFVRDSDAPFTSVETPALSAL